MEQLGYYAMDKYKNLFRFVWSGDDRFYLITDIEELKEVDIKDYTIIEIGVFKKKTPEPPKPRKLTKTLFMT